MYSGTTLRSSSGKLLGAHQKFDRVARRALKSVAPELPFPGVGQILHFEGLNGPDGIKRKSPARDEPWHYFNPIDDTDRALIDMVADHRVNLIRALRKNNIERAAFEAAWMAHALVDGLTPAHHFPFEEVIEGIRGEAKEERTTVVKKLIYPGKTPRERFRNNWYVWGAGGAMTTHGLFELGIATTIKTLPMKNGYPTPNDLIRARSGGIEPLFIESARQIHGLDMYTAFQKNGWTSRLARQTRQDLAPHIVKIITLAWYEAAWQAHHKKAGYGTFARSNSDRSGN